MIITQKAIPRRTVLRGLGASLALPLLDGMVPAFAAMRNTAANPTRRLAVVYVPNGMMMEHWTPAAEGDAFDFPMILKPLEPYRRHVQVLSGMRGVESPGPHARASTRFLTGMPSKPDDGSNLLGGVSMDQIAGRVHGRETQLATLELALDGRDFAGSCDDGFSCAYTNTIAWANELTPLPMENNPRAVFEMLFGDTGSTDPAVRKARLSKDASLIDSVTERAADLSRQLGSGDRAKLDQYLDAVRDVERRIQMAEAQSDRELPVVAQPAGIPGTMGEHAALMFDLLALAYETDLTRVATFMLGREITGRTYAEIGVPDAHHPDLAPPAGPGKAAEADEDQPVSRPALRRLRGASADNPGRRRFAARPFDDRVRCRYGRQQLTHLGEPANPAGRRRRRQRRASRQVPGGDADGQSPPEPARQDGCAGGIAGAQHRPSAARSAVEPVGVHSSRRMHCWLRGARGCFPAVPAGDGTAHRLSHAPRPDYSCMLLRLLRTWLRPYRPWLLGVVVLQFVATIAALFLPSLNADIIDNGVARGDTGYIARTGIVMLAVALVQIAATVAAVYCGARTAMGLGRDMRAAVFQRVGSFSSREMARFGAPSLITRNTNDVQQVQMLVLLSCTLMVSAPIMMAGGVIMALREDIGLSWLLGVSVPALLISLGVVIYRDGAELPAHAGAHRRGQQDPA